MSNILPGQVFGYLTVIDKSETPRYWAKSNDYDCLCVCGKITQATARQLAGEVVRKRSCGCKSREMTKPFVTTHGKGEHRLYRIYHHMKERCINPKNDSYDNYGGRGIEVCDEWRDDFMEFYNWALANGYEETLTIDRIDNNGNYEPGNCRWVNQKVQQNNRRMNRVLQHNGQSMTSTQWAEHLNISYKTLERRINHLGWPTGKALTKPLRKRATRILVHEAP